MMACDECGVSFTGELDRCPLCGSALAGTPSPSAFPVSVVQRTSTLARRALAALTVACITATVFGAVTLHASWLSTIALCAAILVAYLFVRNLLVHTPDVLRIVERYFLILLALCAIWFITAGNTIATTYVIPFISIAAILFNSVLVALERDAFVAGYAKYLLYNVVLGFAPLVFVATGLADNAAPAIASAIAAVVLVVLLGILTRRQTADEARKLFSL